jgi:hypothetical protein
MLLSWQPMPTNPDKKSATNMCGFDQAKQPSFICGTASN